MKLFHLPLQLFKFWYPQSLVFFIRTYKHLIQYLEEDLAVGLMLKLLFVPLFHDATIVGRLLSFGFRIIRIFMGVFAFFAVTLLVMTLALSWFATPVLVIYLSNIGSLIFKAIAFSGVVYFIHYHISHPAKKTWQIKNPGEIWQASFIKKDNLSLSKLLKDHEVVSLLSYLEKAPEDFLNFPQTQASDHDFLQEVMNLAKYSSATYFKAAHFFVAMIIITPGSEQLLLKMDLKPQDLIDALDLLGKKEKFWRLFWIWDEDFPIKHLRGVNRGWLGVPTPLLDAVSHDLTKVAASSRVEDFIGRSPTVHQVVNILSQQNGRNVILVGEAGSGKSTLVNYLAKLIVSGDAPESLSTKRLVEVDFAKLLSGVSNQGDLAAKIEAVFNEAEYSSDIVIFVDEMQNLGIGEAGSTLNLYSLLLPHLESNRLQFIATTEVANYTKVLEKDASLARLFAKVEIPPASVEETVEILKIQAIEHERYDKIKTSVLALKDLAVRASEYLHERVLPDSALNAYSLTLPQAENGWIKKALVEKVVSEMAKVPFVTTADQNDELLDLDNLIHQRYIDQEEAVSAIANALRISKAGLKDKDRPIGSFLFVGPTGVGKTELSRIVADIYFKGAGQFVRLDMSEYQTTTSVDRLIGPTGEEGELTENVRHNPHSLVLLDEFEKADPKLLNLFLQVLDDGRLTSGSGRVVDFKNTIIIATSNAASVMIAQAVQRSQNLDNIKQAVLDELIKVFKPELLNRFDDVVIFKPLPPGDLEKIIGLKLQELQERLREQGYLVEFDSALVSALAQKGYDPVFGARPLRRLIHDTIEARLSVMILENKLTKGQSYTLSSDLLR